MTAKIHRRSRFLVENRVQGALGVRIVLHWLLFLALSLTINVLLRLVGNIGALPMLEVVQIALLDQAVPAIVLLALLPWFVHDSLKLSNRFAGPIVRMRTAFNALKQSSEVAPVKFRKGDFWQEVASEFNQLQKQILDERAELHELRAKLAEGTDTVAENDAQDGAPDHASLSTESSVDTHTAPTGVQSVAAESCEEGEQYESATSLPSLSTGSNPTLPYADTQTR